MLRRLFNQLSYKCSYFLLFCHNYILTSMSTPAGISRCIRASIVFGVGSIISITLLWVLISKASLAFFSTWGEVKTVILSIFVGRGIGPATLAPVRRAVSRSDSHVESSTLWSYDFSRTLIRPLAIIYSPC